MTDAYDAIFDGDWRQLPQGCSGKLEAWDQTVGCPACGMNLWNLPEHGQWPAWAADSEPAADHWETAKTRDVNPYDAYMELLMKIHPDGFKEWSEEAR